MPRTRDRYSIAATPHKSPIKIPLNDDRQEKANRLYSRQALYELQLNQIKAAATPLRRRLSIVGGSPATPGRENEDENIFSVGGNAVTPMKRVPILANFEEWMKMATDNKINATNSWNFALIDYFHDMSLLKEGDGVNFQRASCTLDGCVKIYTSRVDSVATETGKLLSGLADSNNKKRSREDGEVDAEDNASDDEGEDGAKKRKKRTQRSSEATLATSFTQIQLKKMELEFSVDPLFKKASADFDEGGAKGLLLNHLAIDGEGRIVFDSSDDAQDASADEGRESTTLETADPEDLGKREQLKDADVDISVLGAKFFPDLSRLDERDICPSLKSFVLGDSNGSLDLPFLKAPDDWRQDRKPTEMEEEKTALLFDNDNVGTFDDDDDADLGGLDLAHDIGFGEGGEAWAREAALEPQMRVHTVRIDGGDGEEEEVLGEVGEFKTGTAEYGVSLAHGREADHENILNYFDQALQKNWAGPEHWRIRRIKDASNTASTGTTKRKEKEPFEIDFSAPMSQALADALYVPSTSSSSISLPKTQWKAKTRNLLPDDKHFNSQQLLRLFLKPKARMGSRKPRQPVKGSGSQSNDKFDGEMDEVFWARKEEPSEMPNPDEVPRGNYDADFFQDDGLDLPGSLDDDDEVFADARDHFSPPREGEDGNPVPLGDVLGPSQEGAFGTQLVTQSRRLRPEYVQYARVAKKVDVRRLKEEMWRGIGFEEILPPPTQPTPPPSTAQKAPDGSLKFTDVINNLQTAYPKQAMADISTSYCFICLLHLANEKGLVINNEENFQDLTIRKDLTAYLSVEAD